MFFLLQKKKRKCCFQGQGMGFSTCFFFWNKWCQYIFGFISFIQFAILIINNPLITNVKRKDKIVENNWISLLTWSCFTSAVGFLVVFLIVNARRMEHIFDCSLCCILWCFKNNTFCSLEFFAFFYIFYSSKKLVNSSLFFLSSFRHLHQVMAHIIMVLQGY